MTPKIWFSVAFLGLISTFAILIPFFPLDPNGMDATFIDLRNRQALIIGLEQMILAEIYY